MTSTITFAAETQRLVFVQLFGSALQLTSHFHFLIPEAVWMRDGQRVDIRPSDEKALESIFLHKLLFKADEMDLPNAR